MINEKRHGIFNVIIHDIVIFNAISLGKEKTSHGGNRVTMTVTKTKGAVRGRTVFNCDFCPKKFTVGTADYDQAIKTFKNLIWHMIAGKHQCPDCYKKGRK